MINYKEMNDFIIKVFNYYNGKINVVNKAVLDINWCNFSGSMLSGISKLPNIVVIYPHVIFRFCDYNEFNIKVQILETVIHELHHTDQLINYNLYAADINYNRFIEHACEIQTAIYLTGHSQEIYNIFGLNISINKNDFDKIIKYWHYPGVKFQRRYFHDHIFMCLDNLCGYDKELGESIYDIIKYQLRDGCGIIININEDTIPVYMDGNKIGIDDFNRIIIKYQCNGTYDAYSRFDTDENENFIITISMETMNMMCKKV